MEQPIESQNSSTGTGIGSDSSQTQESQEKMIPQSQVNRILQSRLSEKERQTEKRIREEYEGRVSNNDVGGNVDASVEELKNVISASAKQEAEKYIKELHATQLREYAEREGKRIEADIMSKLASVKDKYSDYDAVVPNFPFQHFPNAVLASVDFDNTGDILVELAKNPAKLEQLERLAQLDSKASGSSLAKQEMKRLSDSIKLNEQALKQKQSNPPLSTIKPSSFSDDGSDSLQSLKRQYRY